MEFSIDDKLLLSTLAAGLGEDLSSAASNLPLLAAPTFENAVAYLRLEERRLKGLRDRESHTAFVAGVTTPPPRAPAPPPAPAPSPAPGGNGGR